MHVAELLLARGDSVFGIDNLNDYYDRNLKISRMNKLKQYSNFQGVVGDVSNREVVNELFKLSKPERVVHLAAQPGIRYSLINPSSYIQSNLVGFANMLEECRNGDVEHFVYASSSSVYGASVTVPFSVTDNVDHPVNLYAATKKSNELMAHAYSHLFALPCTGLRYFTVYGPWGRPDMSTWLFTEAIYNNQPINVFNYGKMRRDFTYVDDIAQGTIRVLDNVPKGATESNDISGADFSKITPYKIYNIGNNHPIELSTFIEVIEEAIGRKAIKNYLPMQPGDMYVTYANIDDLKNEIGFSPNVDIAEGIGKWVDWYKRYHHL